MHYNQNRFQPLSSKTKFAFSTTLLTHLFLLFIRENFQHRQMWISCTLHHSSTFWQTCLTYSPPQPAFYLFIYLFVGVFQLKTPTLSNFTGVFLNMYLLWISTTLHIHNTILMPSEITPMSSNTRAIIKCLPLLQIWLLLITCLNQRLRKDYRLNLVMSLHLFFFF